MLYSDHRALSAIGKLCHQSAHNRSSRKRRESYDAIKVSDQEIAVKQGITVPGVASVQTRRLARKECGTAFHALVHDKQKDRSPMVFI